MDMTSRQLLTTINRALAEVSRRLASGELDQSGRYYTDEELAAFTATGGMLRKKDASEASPAASIHQRHVD